MRFENNRLYPLALSVRTSTGSAEKNSLRNPQSIASPIDALRENSSKVPNVANMKSPADSAASAAPREGGPTIIAPNLSNSFIDA